MKFVDSATGLEVLERDECLRLLAGQRIGRIAVVDGGAPLLLPIAYVLDGEDVIFRTGAGSKLAAVRHGSAAAIEIDGVDEPGRTGWSVVVTGHTEEVVDERELERLAALPLQPWVPGPVPHWIRVRPHTVSGRRITG